MQSGQVNHSLLKFKQPGSATSVLASQGMGQFPGNLQKAGQSVIQTYKAANCTVIRSLPPHLEIKHKQMHKLKCGLEKNHCPDNTEWEQEGK